MRKKNTHTHKTLRAHKGVTLEFSRIDLYTIFMFRYARVPGGKLLATTPISYICSPVKRVNVARRMSEVTTYKLNLTFRILKAEATAWSSPPPPLPRPPPPTPAPSPPPPPTPPGKMLPLPPLPLVSLLTLSAVTPWLPSSASSCDDAWVGGF